MKRYPFKKRACTEINHNSQAVHSSAPSINARTELVPEWKENHEMVWAPYGKTRRLNHMDAMISKSNTQQSSMR